MPKASQYVNSVGISGDGQTVIGGTYFYDYRKNANQPAFTVGVFVWNANGKLRWHDKFSATEGVYWVALSRDGTIAAAGGLEAHANGFIYAYDALGGGKQLSDTTNSRVNMVGLSGDGAYFVAGSNSLRLYKRTGTA
jgi:WD40 repeat protein